MRNKIPKKLVRNLREKKRFGDIDINGRIILKWILEE
jgi:hypothetical protein